MYWFQLVFFAKEYIDKSAKEGYNVVGCSRYADQKYTEGKYDEAWTEYRTKEMMEGVFDYEIDE